MTDLMQLLSHHATLTVQLAATEKDIRKAEREYWTTRGFSVLPRRERLIAALAEDAEKEAKTPTPIEAYIEGLDK